MKHAFPKGIIICIKIAVTLIILAIIIYPILLKTTNWMPRLNFTWEANYARSHNQILYGEQLNELNLNKLDMSQLKMPYADLSWSSLWRANLSGSDLSNAKLGGAVLIRAICRGTNFNGASLAKSNLTLADLTSANLTHADLHYANLLGANLTGANLTGANLQDAQYDQNTRWPEHFALQKTGAKYYFSDHLQEPLPDPNPIGR